VSEKSIWRAVSVHDTNGRVFANKLEASEAFEVLGDLTTCPSWYNMRTLGTAIRMIVENKSCKRLMVPVDMRTIEGSGMQYARLLMTIPLEMRSKIFVELQTRGKPVSRICASFAQAVQEEGGMSVAVWARCGSNEYLDEVMAALSPSILAIDGKCLKAAMASGDRRFYIDAVECATNGGARVLAAGVDTADEMRSMEEIGVELVCGALKSKIVGVEEGVYEAQSGIMRPYERRKQRRQATTA
jgi:hypothetical protein